MKKSLLIILMVLLCVFTLSACAFLDDGAGDENKETGGSENTAETNITKLSFQNASDIFLKLDTTLNNKNWLNVTANKYDADDITFSSSRDGVVDVTKGTKSSTFIWYEIAPTAAGATVITATADDVTSDNSINVFVYDIHDENNNTIHSTYYYDIIVGNGWSEDAFVTLFNSLKKSTNFTSIMFFESFADEFSPKKCAVVHNRDGEISVDIENDYQ